MTPPPADEILPPYAPRTVYRTLGLALAVAAVPAALGLVELGGTQYPAFVSTLRLVLVGVAALVGAAGLTLRPTLPAAWLLAAATAVAVMFGLPQHWDSFRMVARVLAGLAAAGGVLAALSPCWRYGLLSAAALFHFGSLLVATTWPEPAPWVSLQLAGRVYTPYYRFLYLGNAYHFYSPEPGPANHLFVLIKFEVDGQEKPDYGWVDVPSRRDHYKDPLGMTYYRRLSLTELVSSATPGGSMAKNFAELKARERRTAAALSGEKAVPLLDTPDDPATMQYRLPYAQLRAQTLPSYARHIAHEYGGPGRKVASVKLFRVEHKVLRPQLFLGGYDAASDTTVPRYSPFDPITYKPYYLGEFNADGDLLSPLDPMLYWLVPILPRPVLDPSDPAAEHFTDHMSEYAGPKFPWLPRSTP